MFKKFIAKVNQTVFKFRLLQGDNLFSLASKQSRFRSLTGSGVVGNVYLKYSFTDLDKPLVFTFANAGSVTTQQNIDDQGYSPWGFEFVKSYGVNVISFSTISPTNWYRNKDFHHFIVLLGKLVSVFNERIGYGGSMGGYAVSAYANTLEIDRLLLMNPISTLSEDLVPWETRFKHSKKNWDWSHNCYDGATSNATNIITYDPLFSLDAKHAARYHNRINLKVPGIGHGVPKHLNNLGALKLAFEMFLYNAIEPELFHKKVRNRRHYTGYYKWLLSNQNKHLTPRRASVIEKHFHFMHMSKIGKM